MRIAYPWILALIPLFVVAVVLVRQWLAPRRSRLTFPGVRDVRRLGPGARARVARWLPWVRVVAVALGLLALARPQFHEREEKLVGEAIDIILALDVSLSMKAEDFQPNRLHVAKERAIEFVRGRQGDRIGLVIFGGDAFTKCPLTRDYGVLAGLLRSITFEDVQNPGATAIGMAIAASANRLKDSEAESKVVILLTDGINNSGSIDPLTAAELCGSLGIKVYTIGVGSEADRVPFPDIDAFGRKRLQYKESKLDEESLTQVATTAGGLYFRATDPEALGRIYERISDMEKTDIETEVHVRYSEVGPFLALIALGIILTELLLAETLLLRTWE
jgi:Ca-activated chloride channel family protein